MYWCVQSCHLYLSHWNWFDFLSLKCSWGCNWQFWCICIFIDTFKASIRIGFFLLDFYFFFLAKNANGKYSNSILLSYWIMDNPPFCKKSCITWTNRWIFWTLQLFSKWLQTSFQRPYWKTHGFQKLQLVQPYGYLGFNKSFESNWLVDRYKNFRVISGIFLVPSGIFKEYMAPNLKQTWEENMRRHTYFSSSFLLLPHQFLQTLKLLLTWQITKKRRL